MKISGLTAARLLGLSMVTVAMGNDLWENEPIRYSVAEARDPAAVLERELNSGATKIEGSSPVERLRWVLARLNIPEESQVLVFSKTSKQNSLISPWSPRALYFSENAYVGYVPGGQLEVISHDPALGPVFRMVDMGLDPVKERSRRMNADCLSCHGTARTGGVPGVMVRSVFPNSDGRPILRHGTKDVNDATPLPDRWGGYYVTGSSSLAHLGNRTFREDESPTPAGEPAAMETLSGKIDTSRYPRVTSDIVALLVLEHQCRIYNLITAASYRHRRMEWMGKLLHREGEPPSSSFSSITEQDAREITDALLFRDAASLGDGVEGDEAFQAVFAKRFPATRSGKSLADFHLGGKLFKNRCSYMVYSETFKTMPAELRNAIIGRLREILRAPASLEGYEDFKVPERGRIDEILRETLTGYGE